MVFLFNCESSLPNSFDDKFKTHSLTDAVVYEVLADLALEVLG